MRSDMVPDLAPNNRTDSCLRDFISFSKRCLQPVVRSVEPSDLAYVILGQLRAGVALTHVAVSIGVVGRMTTTAARLIVLRLQAGSAVNPRPFSGRLAAVGARMLAGLASCSVDATVRPRITNSIAKPAFRDRPTLPIDPGRAEQRAISVPYSDEAAGAAGFAVLPLARIAASWSVLPIPVAVGAALFEVGWVNHVRPQRGITRTSTQIIRSRTCTRTTPMDDAVIAVLMFDRVTRKSSGG